MSVFRSTKSFYQYDASDILAHNLKERLKYGLLEMGAYTVVKFSTEASGYTNLKRVRDERFSYHPSSGSSYEGIGEHWAWETDVTSIASGISSIYVPSGIFINNTFMLTATTSGTFSHKIDFRNGRVIFDNPIPSASAVKCEYTFNDVAVYLNDDPQWKSIVDEYVTRFANIDSLSPSGMAMKLKEDRVWLPCVVVDVHSSDHTGLQLGGGELTTYRVSYHIFSDYPFIAKKLSDLLNGEENKVFNLYDVNTAAFPYNFDGSLNSGRDTYKNLSADGNDNFWTFAHIKKSRGGVVGSITDLYRAEIINDIDVPRYISTY